MRHRMDGSGQLTRWHLLLQGTLALAALCVLMLAVSFLFGLLDTPKTQEEALGTIDGRFPPTATMTLDGTPYAYYENYFTNILLIGVDKTDIDAGASYRNGGQADFLLLLSIDRRSRTITPIHIDRDAMAQVMVYSPFGLSAGEQTMQICLAHAFGGSKEVNCRNTIRAVEGLLYGVKVDHYLVLDMTGIALLNDALGGVTVTLTEDFSHLDPAMTAGATLRLQGMQAEYYVRGRHNVGDTTNRQRMTRQQEFITKLAELLSLKVSQSGAYLGELLDTLSGHLYTSMDQAWLSNQTFVLEHYERKDIISLTGEHRMGRDGFVEFHPDEDALRRLIVQVFMEPESEAIIP